MKVLAIALIVYGSGLLLFLIIEHLLVQKNPRPFQVIPAIFWPLTCFILLINFLENTGERVRYWVRDNFE